MSSFDEIVRETQGLLEGAKLSLNECQNQMQFVATNLQGAAVAVRKQGALVGLPAVLRALEGSEGEVAPVALGEDPEVVALVKEFKAAFQDYSRSLQANNLIVSRIWTTNLKRTAAALLQEAGPGSARVVVSQNQTPSGSSNSSPRGGPRPALSKSSEVPVDSPHLRQHRSGAKTPTVLRRNASAADTPTAAVPRPAPATQGPLQKAASLTRPTVLSTQKSPRHGSAASKKADADSEPRRGEANPDAENALGGGRAASSPKITIDTLPDSVHSKATSTPKFALRLLSTVSPTNTPTAKGEGQAKMSSLSPAPEGFALKKSSSSPNVHHF